MYGTKTTRRRPVAKQQWSLTLTNSNSAQAFLAVDDTSEGRGSISLDGKEQFLSQLASTVFERPKYKSLAAAIERHIRSNAGRHYMQLPTEPEFAIRLRLSRETVRRALGLLVEEGLIERIAGRGTFVRYDERPYSRFVGSINDLTGWRDDTTMRIEEQLTAQINPAVARQLGLANDLVHSLLFTRSAGDQTISVVRSYFPPAIGSRLASLNLLVEGSVHDSTVVGLLESEFGLVAAEAEQSITVDRTDQLQAELLGCELRHPVLRIDRVYISSDHVPMELAISYLLPELYSHRSRIVRAGSSDI